MGLLAKEKSSDFKLLEPGTHLAICNAVIGVGVQETMFGSKEKVYIRWEVPAERVQYEKDGEQVNLPMTIWGNYTNSISKKANLNQLLNGWRGKAFTPEERKGFELFDLVGVPCLLTVVHNESGDNVYANVQSVARVMKGQEIPTQEMPSIVYSNEDTEQWEDVPEWLQDKVKIQVKKELSEEPATEEFADDVGF